MSKKHSFDYVKETIEAEGFTLLSTEYINDSTPMDMLCPEGHPISKSFNRWKNRKGNACKQCQSIQASNTTDSCSVSYLTLEDLKLKFQQEGYELLSEPVLDQSISYKDKIKQKIKIKCKEGHLYTASLRGWLRGNRCKECRKDQERKSLTDIAGLLQQEEYVLLSKTYNNAHEKLKVRCPKGHTYEVSWNKWAGGPPVSNMFETTHN